MNRFAKMFALAAPLVAATLLHHGTADACGGCFVPPSSTTVVSGHRMALSVSMQRTVLWDQIEYQGNPEDFSWVLPIKPGAIIEEADPAWFEALEGSTTTTVVAPPLNCNGGGDFGCGSSQSFAAAGAEDSGDNGGTVTVVKQETIGPYESVTLSSKDAGALAAWLTSHGYDIPEDVNPVIGAYVQEGFDFIALRLKPGNGVNLMKPVRVITDGASPVLPLRMVAAGTGPFTSIVLYVIGEGRWETQNFLNLEVPRDNIVWDGDTNSSNYAALREQTLNQPVASWLTSYAVKGALLNQGYDPTTGGTTGIGFTYFQQILDPDGTNYDQYNACQNKLYSGADPAGVVVDLCDADGVCATPQAGQIDSRDYDCDTMTDLSTALVGMHPQDVWVTRLEANLPRAALAQDLQLGASSSQDEISNVIQAESSQNYECPATPVGPLSSKGKPGPGGNGTPLVIVGLGAMAMLLAARRARQVRPTRA